MSAGLPSPDLILSGQIAPERARQPIHVPFTVPAGTSQLHIRYEYNDQISSDPARAGNTLDLGLFDERGLAPGSPGFRGWSGSARASFTIDESWATPPYRSGRALGICCSDRTRSGRAVSTTRSRSGSSAGDATPPTLPPLVPATRPAPAEPGWVRGDLHCHTLRSDGDAWPVEILAAATLAGLDFLAITDHNSPPLAADAFAGVPEMPVLLPGIEVTTYGGHWNVWGVADWFEFRDVSREGTAAAMAAAIAAGGFVSGNHPKPLGPNWSFGERLGYHAVEIWNGPWPYLNPIALAWWETHLRRGERIVAVGGSDTHHLRATPSGPFAVPRLGHPTTWVRIDGPLTAASLLAALRQGHCFVSASPAGPPLYLERRNDDVRVRVIGGRGAALLLLGDAGCVAAEAIHNDDHELRISFTPGASYLRAQVVDEAGNLLAASNPVWRQ